MPFEEGGSGDQVSEFIGYFKTFCEVAFFARIIHRNIKSIVVRFIAIREAYEGIEDAGAVSFSKKTVTVFIPFNLFASYFPTFF